MVMCGVWRLAHRLIMYLVHRSLSVVFSPVHYCYRVTSILSSLPVTHARTGLQEQAAVICCEVNSCADTDNLLTPPTCRWHTVATTVHKQKAAMIPSSPARTFRHDLEQILACGSLAIQCRFGSRFNEKDWCMMEPGTCSDR